MAEQVRIGERQLHCSFCGNDTFEQREGQLNTQLATAFNLDSLNPSARCYICSECGHIEWFM
jgi:hypothetical protein